jgi:hypothetical protein
MFGLSKAPGRVKMLQESSVFSALLPNMHFTLN